MDIISSARSLEDEPAIEENPTMFNELWNNPMMLIGVALVGIAGLVAVGIGCWKMFASNDEDESVIEIGEPIVLRNRNVKRRLVTQNHHKR